MQKKKVKKIRQSALRFLGRLAILNIPCGFILLVLFLKGEISFGLAIFYLLIVFIITSIITLAVFHELDVFISYLKNLSLGQEVDVPSFHRGLFGSKRLARTFMILKNRWTNQRLSEGFILENLPDPLLLLDTEKNIIFANTAGTDLWGKAKTIADLNPSLTFQQALESVFNCEEEVKNFEWFCENGTWFWVRIERLPPLIKQSSPVMILLHDITALKLFRQQQTDFFANASHELKTPLSVLTGMIETLQTTAKDDKHAQEKFLNMMADQTRRMTQLVGDILSLAKLQMQEVPIFDTTISMTDLVQSVVQDLQLKAAASDKKIVVSALCNIPPIRGNKTHLTQAVRNLVENALKYGADKSVVTLTLSLTAQDNNEQIMLAVHNMGNPIPPRQMNRIFERFYRVYNNTPVEGTGLGLSIAQRIAEQHGGKITLTSSAKKGTTFYFYIPLNL